MIYIFKKIMQTCISDMKTQMTQNKVKLNNVKTELMKSNRTIVPDAQPTALCAGTKSHSSTVI